MKFLCIMLPLFFSTHVIAAKLMHSEVWKEQIQLNMAEDMCQARDYVRNCYEVSQQECLVKIQGFARQCIRSTTIPAKIDIYGNGIKLAYKIGICVGKEVNNKFQKSENQDGRCQSIYAWVD